MKTIATAAALALTAATAFAQTDRAGDIEVAHPWAAATTETKLTNSAVYMSLTDRGTSADELVAASSPVAQKVQLHVFGVENGVYGMHKVDAIAITPGAASTVLRPGGAHVMLVSLTRPLRAGMTIPLTLTFQNAGSLTIEVPIESRQPAVADAAVEQASKVPRGLFLTTHKGARPGAESPSR
jgi:periplasmic copper chaperone A